MTTLSEIRSTLYPNLPSNVWFSNEHDVEDLIFQDRNRCPHCESIKDGVYCDNESCSTYLQPITLIDTGSMNIRDSYGSSMSMGIVGRSFGASDQNSRRIVEDIQDIFHRGNYAWHTNSSHYASR